MSINVNNFEDLLVNNRLVTFQNAYDSLVIKCIDMFAYEGMPLTVPTELLEQHLVEDGAAVIYMVDDELFVTDTRPSRGQDVYGRPQIVDILHGHEMIERTVDVDCVYIKNDSLGKGLQHILHEYSLMLSQGKLTMLRQLQELRSYRVFQALDENSYKAVQDYENALRRGDSAVIMAGEMSDLEGVMVHMTPPSGNPTTQFIELFQYINSYYLGELGITTNNNMKREYVSDAEISMPNQMPLIQNMLSTREDAIARLNALFDLDVVVQLSNHMEEFNAGDDEQPNDEFDDAQSEWDDDEGDRGEETPEGDGVSEEPESEDAVNDEAPVDESVDDEPEEYDREEVLEAQEVLDVEDETDSASGDSDDRPDSGEDEADGDGMETEEDDDEGSESEDDAREEV